MYTFDNSGKLSKIEDGRGNTHTLTYSGNVLSQVSDGTGRTLSFSYDGSGHLSMVSDGTRTINFGYTGNDLTGYTDARGNVTTYTYAAGGLMASRIRPSGNIPYSQTYDLEARVTNQTDALGNTHTFAYNSHRILL